MKKMLYLSFVGLCLAYSIPVFVAIGEAQEAKLSAGALKTAGQVAFTEGPAWHPDGSVYFTDHENNRIMRRDASGKIRVHRKPSGRANGLAFDLQGRMIACEGAREGGNRRVTRTAANGVVSVLADRYEGKRFNSPNDVCVDTEGFLFFTDPRYGDTSDVEMRTESGALIEGVYRIAPDGDVKRILKDEVQRPNGIAISTDNRYLFVADNASGDPAKGEKSNRLLVRFELDKQRDIVPDSKLVLFDWGMERGPDGMAMDEKGNLYVTAGLNFSASKAKGAERFKAGIYVIDPEGKGLKEFIPVPIDSVTNCTFGADDRKTLFITAGHKLWSIRTKYPGYLPWLEQGGLSK
ncbi:MAG: SMP-30/gluconolactonase/LRE family protein [Planctomycetota bacterium]